MRGREGGEVTEGSELRNTWGLGEIEEGKETETGKEGRKRGRKESANQKR